jgi:hypothetical protein
MSNNFACGTPYDGFVCRREKGHPGAHYGWATPDRSEAIRDAPHGLPSKDGKYLWDAYAKVWMEKALFTPDRSDGPRTAGRALRLDGPIFRLLDQYREAAARVGYAQRDAPEAVPRLAGKETAIRVAIVAALRAIEAEAHAVDVHEHRAGESHRYRIECEVCGQRGMVNLSIEPQYTRLAAESEEETA